MIDEDQSIKFSGVAMGQACTIVLRGASHHVLDGEERSLHDALCVLSQTVNDNRVLRGGGWSEMVMAKEVDALVRKTPGKKSLAMEAFSHALFAIPTEIADNAGLDSAELISQFREEHQTGRCTTGIDVISGSVGDLAERGICEAFKVKHAVLLQMFVLPWQFLVFNCYPRIQYEKENQFVHKKIDRLNNNFKAIVVKFINHL